MNGDNEIIEEVKGEHKYIPKERDIYIGVWQSKDGYIFSTGHPSDNKQNIINALHLQAKKDYEWRSIISINVPYEKKS